ncbi:MAG: hypothetical protein MUF01_01985 [Bryobacterales bacterium]|jgi:predicted secreted hydrolase|nr:hypothetical protein [Bryobacterales bacterium]
MTSRRQLLQLLSAVVGASAFGSHARAASSPWRLALPGYRYQFPRDHMAHPDFQTEWWYFTGNLRDQRDSDFGYELTFFRQARQVAPDARAAWQTGQLYLAHFALTDVAGGGFEHRERLNRPGPGLAGADASTGRVWNGNWQAQLTGDHDWRLQAVDAGFAIELDLRSAKQPVLHGENGIHQKASEAGRASHYISLTRLETAGTLTVRGRRMAVRGLSWMDHEFFTSQLGGNQVGWDWFSIQLDDGAELMIYRLRRRDGSIEPLSGGSYVHPDGRWERLRLEDFTLRTRGVWTSPRTGGVYPTAWDIGVPRLHLRLTAQPLLDHQELVSERRLGPSYWEGLMQYQGTRQGKSLSGKGYLELTGYAGDVDLSGQERGGLTR